jgi:hypothetical protein
MFKNVLPAITALFAGANPCRQPVNFHAVNDFSDGRFTAGSHPP